MLEERSSHWTAVASGCSAAATTAAGVVVEQRLSVLVLDCTEMGLVVAWVDTVHNHRSVLTLVQGGGVL